MTTDYTILSDEELLDLMTQQTSEYNKLNFIYAQEKRHVLRLALGVIQTELEKRKKAKQTTIE